MRIRSCGSGNEAIYHNNENKRSIDSISNYYILVKYAKQIDYQLRNIMNHYSQ